MPVRVPYAGFKGDYQAKPVLTNGGVGFPFVGVLTQCSRVEGLECIGTGSYAVPAQLPAFTMADLMNIPQLLVHFDHHARLFRVELVDQDGKSWFRAYDENYLPRNSTSTGFFAFPITGTTFSGGKSYTLPDGTYVAKVSALKALGDASNPAHWDTWTSPAFVIDRP